MNMVARAVTTKKNHTLSIPLAQVENRQLIKTTQVENQQLNETPTGGESVISANLVSSVGCFIRSLFSDDGIAAIFSDLTLFLTETLRHLNSPFEKVEDDDEPDDLDVLVDKVSGLIMSSFVTCRDSSNTLQSMHVVKSVVLRICGVDNLKIDIEHQYGTPSPFWENLQSVEDLIEDVFTFIRQHKSLADNLDSSGNGTQILRQHVDWETNTFIASKVGRPTSDCRIKQCLERAIQNTRQRMQHLNEQLDEEDSESELEEAPAADSAVSHFEIVSKYLEWLQRIASGKKRNTNMKDVWIASHESLKDMLGSRFPHGGINLKDNFPAPMRPKGSTDAPDRTVGESKFYLYCILEDTCPARVGMHGSFHAVVMEIKQDNTIKYWSITKGVVEMFKGRDSRSVPNGWTMSEVYITVGGVGQWILTGALRNKPGNSYKMVRGSNGSARLNIVDSVPSLPTAVIPVALPAVIPQFGSSISVPIVQHDVGRKRSRTDAFPVSVPPLQVPKVDSISEIRKNQGNIVAKAFLSASSHREIGDEEVHVGNEEIITLSKTDRQDIEISKAVSNFLNQLLDDELFSTYFDASQPSMEWLQSISEKRKEHLATQKLEEWIVEEVTGIKFHNTSAKTYVGVATTLTSKGEKTYVISKVLKHPDFEQAFLSFLSNFNRVITYAHKSVDYFSRTLSTDTTPRSDTVS